MEHLQELGNLTRLHQLNGGLTNTECAYGRPHVCPRCRIPCNSSVFQQRPTEECMNMVRTDENKAQRLLRPAQAGNVAPLDGEVWIHA